jgi:hypothetical protein
MQCGHNQQLHNKTFTRNKKQTQDTMFVITTVCLRSLINMREEGGMSHDKLRLGSPVFQGFPFHMCASVSMFCNSISNLLLCFSVFWHCSWTQAHSPYRSNLICVCRLILLDGEQTAIYDDQRHNTPNTTKSNVTAVQHACSNMIIKQNPTNL